jgi:hypothetical protein
MENWIQFAITTIVAILGILAGRAWERYDLKLKKDREILTDILNLLPPNSDVVYFLRKHDFGDDFSREFMKPIKTLINYSNRPDFFFLDKRIENLEKSYGSS